MLLDILNISWELVATLTILGLICMALDMVGYR